MLSLRLNVIWRYRIKKSEQNDDEKDKRNWKWFTLGTVKFVFSLIIAVITKTF